MLSLTTVLSLGYLVAFGYLTYHFVKAYATNTGSTFQRVLASSKQSATLAWAKFSALVGSGVGGIGYVADALNVPQVSSAVQSAVTPVTFAGFVALLTLGSYFARTRKGSTDPVQ